MTTTRQPAYDAVYSVIRSLAPRSSDDYGIAIENARVWRAVEAALDAMGVPSDRVRGSCPYCGLNEPENRWDVCNPCAAAMGWDPPCGPARLRIPGTPTRPCGTSPRALMDGLRRHKAVCVPPWSGCWSSTTTSRTRPSRTGRSDD